MKVYLNPSPNFLEVADENHDINFHRPYKDTCTDELYIAGPRTNLTKLVAILHVTVVYYMYLCKSEKTASYYKDSYYQN
jgi:hypothetical protein